MSKSITGSLFGYSAAAILTAAFAGCAFLCDVYAASAVIIPETEAVHDAQAPEHIKDNIVEWDEIADRIRYCNPSYLKAGDGAMTTYYELSDAYGGFCSEMQDQLDVLESTMEEIEEKQKLIISMPGRYVPDEEGRLVPKEQMLKTLSTAMDQAKSGRKSIKSGITAASRGIKGTDTKIEKALKPLLDNLTKVMQGLTLTRAGLEVNERLLMGQAAVYEASLAAGQTMFQQGMSTELELRQKQAALNDIYNSLTALRNGKKQLEGSMGLQYGFAPGEEFVTGSLPEPDMEYIASIDYEADRLKAVNGNSEVIKAGRAGSGMNRSFELRDMNENEALARAGSAFDLLYSGLMQKKMLYESSQTSLAKAKLILDSAQRMHSLGLTGRAEYEGMQMQYLVSLAAAETAHIDLLQAINDYRWAVAGIMPWE